MVFHQAAVLHNNADHPLKDDPEEQIAQNNSLADRQRKHAPVEEDHTNPIQSLGRLQPWIHAAQQPTFSSGVEDQAHPAKQQTAHGKGMVVQPASEWAG